MCAGKLMDKLRCKCFPFVYVLCVFVLVFHFPPILSLVVALQHNNGVLCFLFQTSSLKFLMAMGN